MATACQLSVRSLSEEEAEKIRTLMGFRTHGMVDVSGFKALANRWRGAARVIDGGRNESDDHASGSVHRLH